MFRHLCVILREFQSLYFAKLHNFLELKLLKLQSHKIIRLKYYLAITVIQYRLCEVTVSCKSSVFMWLNIQSKDLYIT